jgi:hypothetical protein
MQPFMSSDVHVPVLYGLVVSLQAMLNAQDNLANAEMLDSDTKAKTTKAAATTYLEV